MNAGDKKLNEMNRLADMGHFPALVNAGATINILVTLTVTWWLERYIVLHRHFAHAVSFGSGSGALANARALAMQQFADAHPEALHPSLLGRFTVLPPVTQAVLWTALVLILNVTPVILLRLGLRPDTPYPTLRNMNFVHDQHKFSDWVYLAASANMAFWVLSGWAIFSLFSTPGALVATLVIAALATFSPVLLRGFEKDVRE